MINRIIAFSIRNRFLVLLGTAAMALWGGWSMARTPIDAIPDLSENQVIVFTDWMGRSPQEVEDQITYPLSVNLQGLAGVKAVRSTSEFNYSMINVIFEDKVDFYFARVRVLERLTTANTFLPPGVVPALAPDATALGQIFWYTVEGEGKDPGELRAIQDWQVRYALNAVPGVAEVSSVGGMVREYQVDVDPGLLRAYGIPLSELFSAIARSNAAVGGNALERHGSETLVRGIGWIRDARDLSDIVVAQRGGTPVLVGNLAKVHLGPQFRRAVLEKDGGEAVGGVVMMRYGEDPLTVTERVHRKIEEISPGLPEGVRIVPFYERTRLIHSAIDTLSHTLIEEIVVASLVVILILGHLRSALAICATLPLAVLFSFIWMHVLGIPSNIMSLSGIAISIGVLIDAGIVITENAYHRLHERFGSRRVEGDTRDTIQEACQTVGGALFFSLVIMLISFAPVFALTGTEGKMFHPLAFTKSLALLGVALLAITLIPALLPTLMRGRLRAAEDNWLVRSFVGIYRPMLGFLLRKPDILVTLTGILMVVAVPLFPHAFPYNVMAMALPFVAILPTLILARRKLLCSGLILATALLAPRAIHPLGEEFMPPLDEGSILDMPVTVPRASVNQVREDLLQRDQVLRSFPEVESVVGKGGRALTATDPSPIDMVETVINLRPVAHRPRRKMNFSDALAESQRVLSHLESEGQVKPGTDPAARQDLANEAAMDALARFDAWARDLSQTRLVEFRRGMGLSLAREGVQGAERLLGRSGVLLRTPAEGERSQVAQSLGAWHARLLMGLRDYEAEAFLKAAGDALARAGFASAGADPSAAPSGALEGALEPLLFLAGKERATPAQALKARLEKAADRLTAQRVKALNWEIIDRGSETMVGFLAEEILEGARARTMQAGEMPAPERERLVAALAPAFAGDLFLWRKTKSDIVQEMDSALRVPGWGNIWTQPIINRVDMLATGVRTMIGIKVFGDDRVSTVSTIGRIQALSDRIAEALRAVPGAVDVFPDQSVGEGYLEIEIDRRKASRYGVNVADLQDVIEVAIGGRPVTMTVEGRRRFPVRVRYGRDLVQDAEAIRNVLVATGVPMGSAGAGSGGMGGQGAAAPGRTGGMSVQVPLSEVAEVRLVEGPTMIKSENGQLRSYVQCNVRGRDIIGFVEEAQRVVAAKVPMPAGFHIEWSGQFENQVRAKRTLQVVFPAVILLIIVILYITYRDWADTGIMALAVPGAVAGGALFQWMWGFNFSVAVWVGYIACFGMATETAIVMLVYLRESIARRGGLARIASLEGVTEAVMEGAVHRLRPKLLTEATTILGLVPMLWATGTGAEIMRPMAAPILGGILVADEVIDLLVPVLFHWVQCRRWRRLHAST